jgi:hypothetical protein
MHFYTSVQESIYPSTGKSDCFFRFFPYCVKKRKKQSERKKEKGKALFLFEKRERMG